MQTLYINADRYAIVLDAVRTNLTKQEASAGTQGVTMSYGRLVGYTAATPEFRSWSRRSGNTTGKQSFPWGIRLNPVADYHCTEAAIRTAYHCTGLRQSVVSSNLGLARHVDYI
jgi:hypothetical protein